MVRQRNAAPGVVARPKYMNAKFAGSCKCGKRIGCGDLMCYDTATRSVLCVACGKKQSKLSESGLSYVEPLDQGQEIMDHINRLQALPSPLSDSVTAQILRLEQQLRDLAGHDVGLRLRLLKSSVKGSTVAIAARYSGKCSKCNSEQNVGEPVAYDRELRKIYCYTCV